MRNYWKATAAVLIVLFIWGCTKSGADFPDGTPTSTSTKTTTPVATDTTKTVTTPVTTKPDTTKPTAPVTTKPTTPVTTTPTTPTTPVTTKPTTPVTTTPTTPVTTKPTTPVTTTPTTPVTTTPTTPVTTKPTTPVTTTPTTPTTPVTTKPTTPVTATPAPPVTTKPTTATAPVTTKPTTPVTTKPVTGTTKSTTTTPVVKAPTYKLTAPIAYVGKSNITINGDSINGGLLPCISLIKCTNIHIIHCKLVNSTGYGVFINSCTNILVDSCYIGNVRAGVLAEDCPNGQIRIQYNQMKNMQGPYPHADFIQYGHIEGPNNRIIGNKMENIQGQSNPEDGINLFMCDGSPSDPIQVSNNWIRGGGPSITGAGITIGDGGGSYQTITNNIVVNSGYGGIDFAGGTHITVMNNQIYSSSFPWSGCGLGCSNFSNVPAGNNTMTNNKVNWIAGHWGGYRRDTVYRAGTGNNINPMPNGWKLNTVNAPINASILPTTIIDFK